MLYHLILKRTGSNAVRRPATHVSIFDTMQIGALQNWWQKFQQSDKSPHLRGYHHFCDTMSTCNINLLDIAQTMCVIYLLTSQKNM